MLVITKKLDPNKPVEQQVSGSIKRGYYPVLIHQHPGTISKVIPGITTDKLPQRGNYARTTIKL